MFPSVRDFNVLQNVSYWGCSHREELLKSIWALTISNRFLQMKKTFQAEGRDLVILGKDCKCKDTSRIAILQKSFIIFLYWRGIL